MKRVTIHHRQRSTIDHRQRSTIDHRQRSTIDHHQRSTIDHRQRTTIDHRQRSTIDHRQRSTVHHLAGARSDGEGGEGAEQGDDEDKRQLIFCFLELSTGAKSNKVTNVQIISGERVVKVCKMCALIKNLARHGGATVWGPDPVLRGPSRGHGHKTPVSASLLTSGGTIRCLQAFASHSIPHLC